MEFDAELRVLFSPPVAKHGAERAHAPDSGERIWPQASDQTREVKRKLSPRHHDEDLAIGGGGEEPLSRASPPILGTPDTAGNCDGSSARELIDRGKAEIAAAIVASLRKSSSEKLLCFDPPWPRPGRKMRPKIYGEVELAHVLDRIERLSTCPESDSLKVLLTCRQGCRPCEVAGMLRRNLVDATGNLYETLEIMPGTAKRGAGHKMPMHPQVRRALMRLFKKFPEAEHVAFRVGRDGRLHPQSAAAVSQFLTALYAGAGMRGCTGMSGRHSFATQALLRAPSVNASAFDVQALMRHATLNMTQNYVHGAGVGKHLINTLGSEE